MEEELIEITSILPQKEDVVPILQNLGWFQQSEVFNNVSFLCWHNTANNELHIRIHVNQLSRDEQTLLNRSYDVFYHPQNNLNINENIIDVLPFLRDTIRQFNNLYNILIIDYEIEYIFILTEEQLLLRIEIFDFWGSNQSS
jgi:hypothetical protein